MSRSRSTPLAPALSPIEIEKQVTFPIENGTRGHPES